jgi:hypothetical protein
MQNTKDKKPTEEEKIKIDLRKPIPTDLRTAIDKIKEGLKK